MIREDVYLEELLVARELQPQKIKIGADIEFFLTLGGKIISSKEFLEEGQKIITNKGIIERDGYAIEIQPNPSDSWKTLRGNIEELIEIIYEAGFGLSDKSLILLKKEELKDDPLACVFGCKPDINIYTGKETLKPDPKEFLFRSCGGHLHTTQEPYEPNLVIDTGEYKIYGPPKEEINTQIESKLIWADILLGGMSVLLEPKNSRRTFYGSAGDFRYTSYGFEYRTLSNFWVFNEIVMDYVLAVWQRIQTIELPPNYALKEEGLGKLANAINTYNVKEVKKLIKTPLDIFLNIDVNNII